MHASPDPASITLSPDARADNGAHPANHPFISGEQARMAWLLDFSRKSFGLPLSEHLPPLVAQAVQAVCQSEVGVFWQTSPLATDASPSF